MEIIAIRTGLTIQDEGSFYGALLAGYTDSEHPLHLFLSHDDLLVILGFIAKQINHKAEHDFYEKQIYCQHTTVDGKCVACGADEEEYDALWAEREARRQW